MKPEYISVFLHLFVPVTFAVKPLLKREDGGSPIQPVTWFCVHRFEAATKWRNFHSRGYPKALYVKDSRCTWRLQAAKGQRVQIAFKGLDLDADDPAHCSSNYIEIIDETIGMSQAKFCGKNTPGDIISQGRKLRIDFQAQPGRSNMAGFLISYKATTAKPGFYAKKSFETPVTQRPKKTPKMQINYINNLNIKNENDGGQSSSMSTVHIVGLVIGLIIALAVLGFIVRHMYKKRRKKKQKLDEKVSDQVTKFTDLDPNLPHNEVDPFERVDMACGPTPSAPELLPPPYDLRHEISRAQPYPPPSNLHFKQSELPVSRNFSWNPDKHENTQGRNIQERQGREKNIPIYSNDAGYANKPNVPERDEYRPKRTFSYAKYPGSRMGGLSTSHDERPNGNQSLPALRTYPKTLSHKVSHQRADTERSRHKSDTQTMGNLRRLETRFTSRHPQRRADRHHPSRNETRTVSSHHEPTGRVENGRLPSRMTNPSRF